MSFFGRKCVEKYPIIQISGGSNAIQKNAPIFYRRIKANLVWPVTIQLHVDLTDYRQGSYLEKHSDLSSSKPGAEYRVVVILKKAEIGGELLCEGFILNWTRLKIFNTRVPHEVTKIEKGDRRVLLLGLYVSLLSPIGR